VRVSQRADYAMRALVLLALQPDGEYVAAGDLANRLGLPRRFVEQQITALARADIVRCRRGATGGCALARSARDVSALDVVRAVEGGVLDVPHVTGSAATMLWTDAAESLESFLAAVSLADLVRRQSDLDGSKVPMYWI
jgi:Rrf2 family protein